MSVPKTETVYFVQRLELVRFCQTIETTGSETKTGLCATKTLFLCFICIIILFHLVLHMFCYDVNFVDAVIAETSFC